MAKQHKKIQREKGKLYIPDLRCSRLSINPSGLFVVVVTEVGDGGVNSD